MMRYPLKSSFAEQIRSFVDYKNSLGFPYDESCRILWKFDNFCAERFPEKDSLDRELALAWLEKRDTENTAGHRNRIMVIKSLKKAIEDSAARQEKASQPEMLLSAKDLQIQEYDDALTARIIEKITVRSRNEIEIQFTGDYKKSVTLR